MNHVVAILQINEQHTKYSNWGITGHLSSNIPRNMLEAVIFVKGWDDQYHLMRFQSSHKFSQSHLKNGFLISSVQSIHHQKEKCIYWYVLTMLQNGQRLKHQKEKQNKQQSIFSLKKYLLDLEFLEKLSQIKEHSLLLS